MTQESIVISRRVIHYFFFGIVIFFLIGCGEVSPYSYNCKNFNDVYLAKLSKRENIDSARELASLYVECNPEGDKKYKELALEWSEKVISFKNSSENDLKLYRALRNLDIDTGEPEK